MRPSAAASNGRSSCNGRQMRNTESLYIIEDYIAWIRKTRKKLITVMMQKREAGYMAHSNYNKLVVRNPAVKHIIYKYDEGARPIKYSQLLKKKERCEKIPVEKKVTMWLHRSVARPKKCFYL